MPEQHHINVDLGDRGYPIVIGQDLLGGSFDLSRHVAGQHCQIVTNETVAPLYLDRLKDSLPGRKVDTVVLPDGEKYKTVETLVRVFDGLTDAGARRDTTVIALGGGVVGDIAGFAAASYMRGVPYIQVPTTLLAQVDSSVGGKTGVNHAAGKNLIGAFYQPRVVLIDTNTLTTLPDRELKAGLAEVIKHGAICDAAFFEWLEYNIQALLEQDAQALGEAIRRCCQIKSDVVAEDERETGRRAILNFGHTFGHAIERCQGFGSWLHGEAVAAGMVMAASLSGLDVSEQARLSGLIAAAGLPIAAPAIPSKDMRKAMGLDKKAVGESLRFVLLKKLGEAFVTSDYDENLLEAVLGQS